MVPGATVPQPPPAVAQVLPDNKLGLGFGTVPAGRHVVFPDVLRLSSVANKTSQVEFTISGPVADAVSKVGFWDAERGVVTEGLTLRADEAVQIALELGPPADASGILEGGLTVSARLGQDAAQEVELPMRLTVEPAETGPTPGASPGAGGSPEPESSPEPTASPSMPSRGPALRLLANGPSWLPLVLRVGLLL